MNEIAEIMTRVENKMTLLSSSLKELEQKIDSPNDSLDGSMPSDMKFDADISGVKNKSAGPPTPKEV